MIAKSHPLAGLSLAAYVRVSSDKQDAERQREAIKGWATANNLTIAQAHWFEDTVGRNPRDKAANRREFQRLLQEVEAGAVEVIIVDSQDRFGTKDAYELGKYLTQLADHGCQLWSVSQGNLSANDPGAILTTTVQAITSSREQEEKAQRSIGGKIVRAKAGEYQGGYPAFGCDVVCFDVKGKEKWRVAYVGHFARQKITPGKKSVERFDGKNNFPAKDPTDTLGVRPSYKSDRVKIVCQIFEWYDRESISLSQIASRLNKMRIDPVFGDSWNKQKIKCLLSNPVYTGLPTFNKRGGSRFVEYVDGQLRKVQPVKGRIVVGRKRSTADYVQPTRPLFRPIVPQGLFDRVQAKLAASSKGHTSPSRNPSRTAKLWLRNFLLCGKCGKAMRCQASTKSRNVQSYFCSTYGLLGKDNPTGCHCHRVKADLVHKIVEDYLGEAHKRIGSLLQAEQANKFDAAEKMAGEFYKMHEQISDLFDAMHSQVNDYVADKGGQPFLRELGEHAQALAMRPLTKQIRNLGPFAQVYEHVRQQREPVLERRLMELNAEHTELFDRYSHLPRNATLAIRKASERMLALEGEIHGVEDELKNTADEVEGLLTDLAKRKRAIEQVRKGVGTDSEYRRKSELLGQVVERIVCHFRYTGSPNRAKSQLESIEIIPLDGDSVRCFPNRNMPWPG